MDVGLHRSGGFDEAKMCGEEGVAVSIGITAKRM